MSVDPAIAPLDASFYAEPFPPFFSETELTFTESNRFLAGFLQMLAQVKAHTMPPERWVTLLHYYFARAPTVCSVRERNWMLWQVLLHDDDPLILRVLNKYVFPTGSDALLFRFAVFAVLRVVCGGSTDAYLAPLLRTIQNTDLVDSLHTETLCASLADKDTDFSWLAAVQGSHPTPAVNPGVFRVPHLYSLVPSNVIRLIQATPTLSAWNAAIDAELEHRRKVVVKETESELPTALAQLVASFQPSPTTFHDSSSSSPAL